MKVNVTQALKTSMLMTPELAEEFIKQLKVIVNRGVKKFSISFDETMLLSLDFLLPLARYLVALDEQPPATKVTVTIEGMTQLHMDLFLEAIRVVKAR